MVKPGGQLAGAHPGRWHSHSLLPPELGLFVGLDLGGFLPVTFLFCTRVQRVLRLWMSKDSGCYHLSRRTEQVITGLL
ncbi:unnamed protein product [Nezara viridula]|uniref:Uncharacterized protein n=1 Tax=Nezara viridula TaxID=85310 RepID=A0A9P0EC95_NEZVI|nr:unnamed protein product [Nezara viridula]